MPPATATYPGIPQNRIKGGDIMLRHGSRPSPSILYLVPDSLFAPSVGTFQVQLGKTRLILTDVKVTGARLQRFGGRFFLVVRFLDRRWKWLDKRVSGEFNIRRPDGDVDVPSEKLADELFKHVFDAAGETLTNLSKMASDKRRPYVKWLDTPVPDALDELCEHFQCRLTIANDNRATPWPIGEAAPLRPLLRSIGQFRRVLPKYTVQPTVPRRITIKCAPTRYQSRLKLEAQGYDKTAVQQLSLLSYNPANLQQWPPTFIEVAERRDDLTDWARAARSGYRWYKVKSQFDGSLEVPGYSGTVTDMRQLLPLRTHLTQSIDNFGLQFPLPARVQGKWWNYTKELDGEYPGDFSIVPEEGLVLFANPIFTRDTNNLLVGADIDLETSYSVEDLNGMRDRHSLSRAIKKGTDPELVVFRDDLFKSVRAAYTSSGTVEETFDNESAIDEELNDYLDALEKSLAYGTSVISHQPLSGIVPVPLDGITSQVIWRFGRDLPPRTTLWTNLTTDFSSL